MNFSTPMKDPEDYARNIPMFQHKPLIGEAFATRYARCRDIYENSISDLPKPSEL
ncbi:unnamed protein product [Hymenolepis diminuta]|uniref:Uncharacterized protein n=1 Tax=Hymenolepis diminuta TaxID=6216 RepID=A0A564ZAN4_HYMDI|nr:unnamed protein product [Hymenolepis diminuta]